MSVDFDDMPTPRKGFRWAWWVYTLIAIFIVCLLIWMFIALSDDAVDKGLVQPEQPANSQVIDTISPD